MELDSVDKYIHMTKLANGVEVMFAGQPCLKITEGMDSYIWAIYPVFAKLTYGASIFEDVPYCSENFDTMEEAIADGLAKLHSLGAFVGEVDLPEDTYAESGVSESVEDLAVKLEITEETLDSILQDCRAYAIKHSNSIMEAHDLSIGLYESILSEADYSGVNADAKRQGKSHKQMADDHRSYAAKMRKAGQTGLASRSEMLAKEHEAAEKMNEETLDEGIIGKLSGKIMGVAPETPKYKVGQTVSYQSSEPQPDWKDGGSGKGKITKYSNGHYTINGNPINHFEIKKLHEETLDEGAIKDIENKLANHAATKISNEKEFGKYSAADLHQHETVRNQLLQKKKAAQKIYNKKINNESVEETLDEAKALSGDAYWKSKEDAASAEKAKANRASAGIKEPEKKGRGKPTLGATVDEMKDRMRENIAAGKRPHIGFDRNEKLRILRSGAMEHPEFAGTHVKAAGRPVGTTKAAAIEKKKAEPTAFSMWAGLGKK